MPVPAPQPKSYGRRAAAPPAATAPAAAQQPAQPPEQTSSGFPRSSSRPRFFGKSGDDHRLRRQAARAGRPGQRLSIQRAASWSAISSRSAPTARKSEGEFYLQKPGKVRFEYNPPSPIELIADGSSVVVRDRKLATQDLYPLSQTPLRFLLADRIDLMRDTNVIGVYADDVFVTVVIEERQTSAAPTACMLMFGAQGLCSSGNGP